MRKFVRIIGWMVVVLLVVLVGSLLISTISNAVITGTDNRQYPAPGALVTVHGESMHIYSEGSGDMKIVLLSGFGINCPVLDFMGLVEELSTDHTVIVVEYFGYGWSGRTNSPRTVANIVEETREALKLAGFTPPYTLMPHSLSGIYALYYASTYPVEVSAIIGLDSSVPAQLPSFQRLKDQNASIYMPAEKGSFYWEFKRLTGLERIYLALKPLAMVDSYSETDMDLYKTMYLKNYGNQDLIDEADRILDNLLTVENMTIPKDIPSAFILAGDSVEISTSLNNLDWIKAHENLMPENTYGKVIVLEGDHYIYYTQSEEIRKIVDEILKSDME